MIFNRKEDIIAITPFWKGERFEDGRPKVADELLDALYELTLEEVWKAIYERGYVSQFVEMNPLHPESDAQGKPVRKLVGRAVTGQYCPSRPDYLAASKELGESQGYSGLLPNQWIIDNLEKRDVIVIDMFDKIFKGTFLGGNLTTAIKSRTETGGAVIWGGMRDIEQVMGIPDIQIYHRGVDPTGLREICMVGYNTPVTIGSGLTAATCLPGDIVFGTTSGVLFVPPHLVELVILTGRKSKIKDIFGFEMLKQGKYTASEVDRKIWTVEMLDELCLFIAAEEPRFSDLNWEEEYTLARDPKARDESAL